MTVLTKRRAGIASTVVLALVAGLLVWVATRSDGEVVRKADLNDGGVWVTNAEASQFGRINKAAGQLDAGVVSGATPGSGLDVFQDGAAVVGLSRATQQLVPINTAEGTLQEQAAVVLPKPVVATGETVFAKDLVDVRGGTIALIDPAKGALRVQRVDSRGGVTGLDKLQTQAKPVVSVGGNASVAVGVDGTVYAFSAESGVLAVVKQQGDGFAKPVERTLPVRTKSAQVTAVGARWVVFDAASRQVHADGLDEPVQVSVDSGDPGTLAYAAVQQPGPAAGSVLVQDESQLVQVEISDDAPDAAGVKVAQSSPGAVSGSDAPALRLSAPVRVGSCVHAAWAGSSNVYYGRNCGSPQEAQTVDLGAMKKGVRTDGVRLRVNRGLVVLNDLDSGDVWDVDRDRVKIDNWNSVIPPPQVDDKNKQKDQNLVDDEANRQPPKAQPDQMVVRPGRTSTLHVLDNDTDAQGSILAISPGDVSVPSVQGVTASASADGQTVQVTVPEEPGSEVFTFDYTVNNGTTAKTGRATAKVTVRVVGPDVNGAPAPRGGTAKLAKAKYPVVSGGSVKVGVIADWRDPENDPLQIVPKDPSTTGVDGAGALTIKAGAKKGGTQVGYVVDDSHGGATEASVELQVLDDTQRGIAPSTQPDVIRAVVGKPVQLQPLGNDIAGADPSDPQARLRLASEVKGPGQLTLDTNLDSNVVTVTGATPGTSILTYAAQHGGGVAAGRIRVDILPNPDKNLPPVAAPDAAVVRGQVPVVADVLGNDYSPRSDVLVVQRVVTSQAWLRVSVVQGRWVRIQATSPLGDDKERRGTVTYTISDGTLTAEGQVSVVQKAEPKTRVQPNVTDDIAVVRHGDAVTIPVLDNDSMSEGVPLGLDPNGVRVLGGGGQAFVSGTVLRYIPDPAAISSPKQAIVEYTAHPEGTHGRGATGRVTISVMPLPSKTNPNHPPTARSFSASVTAGDKLAITVPTSGVDPDGDLTFVSGIAGATGEAVDLKYGRVLGFGAATIRYEAYPRSAGTEVIRYQLRDRFGLVSVGYIRVGVVQPGDPQPPVAVEDDYVAAPGRTIYADPLANDLISSGDYVELEPLDKLNEPDELKDFTRTKDDTFKVIAPKEDADAKVLTYGISNGLFDPSRSTITVRGQKDFNNPPIAVDDTAEAKEGETSVLVDALENDRDPDGEPSTLKISKFVGDGVTEEGRKLRIQLRPEARVVPYVIEDADGAVAMALIYVPAGNNGLPFVVQGKTVRMETNGTVKVPLADYVADPRGGTISMTSPDTISTSPTEHLQSQATAAGEVTLTATNDYAGPAALMLEVTNAKAPGDKSAQTTYVTIPVQIGPDVPVLRCPPLEVKLVADGPVRNLDIPRVCHAWLPDAVDGGNAEYEVTWEKSAEHVTMSQLGAGGRVLSLKAEPAAEKGTTGTLLIGAKGAPERFKIGVVVTEQPPAATMRPAKIEGLIAGTSRTLNLAQFLDSPLAKPECAIANARVVSGVGVTASASGCTLTVNASDQARKDAKVAVQVTDAPSRPAAAGEVTITVRSKPDPTGAPTAVADRILGSTASVSWQPPPYDGGLPILEYEVAASGGPTQKCASSPCTITGLTNGQPYTFTVRSRNAVDWSDPSPASSPPVIPDTKPEQTFVRSATPGDRTMVIAWDPPVNKGSAILEYQIRKINLTSGGTDLTPVAAGSTSHTFSGLVNNDEYSYEIQARNGAGWGPFGPAHKAQSFGKPAPVNAPRLAPQDPAPGVESGRVSISWDATDPNGPAITEYQVHLRLNGGAWQQLGTTGASDRTYVDDNVPYDGARRDYAVTATNGGPATSDMGAASSYTANGYPDKPQLTSATTPNEDKRAVLGYRLGDSHSSGGQTVTYHVTNSQSGTFSCGNNASCTDTTGALAVGDQTVHIRVCNGAGLCQDSNSMAIKPYGPTQGVGGVRVTNRTQTSVTFDWDRPAYNGNDISGYHVSHTGGGSGCNDNSFSGTSCTVSGLNPDTTVSIAVTPYAPRSGDGPTARQSATTLQLVADVIRVFHGARCNGDCTVRPEDGSPPYQCRGTDCYHVSYELQDFQGGISCTLESAETAGQDWGTEAGRNGINNSGKFYGRGDGWVRVTCRGSNGSDSAIRNPWR